MSGSDAMFQKSCTHGCSAAQPTAPLHYFDRKGVGGVAVMVPNAEGSKGSVQPGKINFSFVSVYFLRRVHVCGVQVSMSAQPSTASSNTYLKNIM